MKTTDLKRIKAIATRAKEQFGIDYTTVFMDVHTVHEFDMKLDLDKLLNFDDNNFMHDIYGINNYLDRNEFKLKQCFIPRCKKQKRIIKVVNNN